MKDFDSPLSAKNDGGQRLRTGSEPPHLLDRFIHPRKENFMRSLAVNFFRGTPRAYSSLDEPSDFSDFDFALEHSLLSLKPLGKDHNQLTLSPLNEMTKSKEASDFYSTSSVYSFHTSGSGVHRFHRLPKKPFRILDIPGLEDDFYTNFLDWSVKNQIAICLDNKVYIHNYESGATDELYEAFECEAVSSLGFSPDGEKLAFGNLLGEVYVYDVEKRSEIGKFSCHTDRIGCIDWKDPGFVTGSKDRTAVFTDPREKLKKRNVVCTHSQEICGVKINNQMNLLATGGNDNRVGVWAFGEGKRLMTGKHASGVKALAWSHRQYGFLATGGGTNDRSLKIWNTNSGLLECERNVEAQVCSVLYSRLTNDLISAQGGELNNVRMWRSKGLKPVGVLTGHEQRPLHLALSPDGSILATASPDEKLCFWRVFDNKLIQNDEPMLFGTGEKELRNDANLMR